MDMKTRETDLEALERINANFIRSVQESDTRWFDENLAQDFLNSNPECSIVGRAAFLAQIGRPAAISQLACEDVRVRVFGDMAVIHGRTTYRKPDGQPGAGRYTDVYTRHEGRWLCVAAHVTRG